MTSVLYVGSTAISCILQVRERRDHNGQIKVDRAMDTADAFIRTLHLLYYSREVQEIDFLPPKRIMPTECGK
jgi:hypothetical protein